jgi:cytochrome c2
MRGRKCLPLVLAAIFLSLTLFIGCGGEEEALWSWDEEPTPTPGATSAAASQPTPSGPVDPESIEVTVDLSQGDAENGAKLFEEKGCVACHKTAEDGPGGEVGPLLAGIGNVEERPILAADIANTPENIWRWVQFPQKIKPGTEMAPLGMDGKEAADLVAFLLTLQ